MHWAVVFFNLGVKTNPEARLGGSRRQLNSPSGIPQSNQRK
jgi:hypothetical protein